MLLRHRVGALLVHHRTWKYAGCLAALVTTLCFATGTAGLAVAPLSVSLKPGAHAAAVTVTNRDPHAWVIQTRVENWSQVDGNNVYQPNPDLLSTPALFRLSNDAKQVVRVGFVGGSTPAENNTEKAYRLFISEVPPSHRPNDDSPNGVQFLVHLVLPVFLPPKHPAVKPQWRLVHEHGQWTLHLRNAGNVHMRLIEVSLVNAAGRKVFDQRGLWYVLAGTDHAWPLKLHGTALPNSLQVRARAARTTYSADVTPRA